MTAAHPLRTGPVPFLLLAPLLLALSGCPSDKPQPGGPDDNAARVARERAASLFAQELFSAALAELEPLLATKNPDPNDQLRAALTLLEFAEGSAAKRAMELLQSAAQAMPDDPRVHYALGSRLNFSGQDELAEGHLRKAMALAPQDLPTQVRLSDVLVVLAYDAEPAEADARLAEALQLLTALRSRGLEFNGSWHLTVLHKAQLLLRQLDRTEEADLAQRELSELESRRIKKPTNPELMRGNLGRLDIPRPAGSQSPAVPDPIIEPAQLLSGEGQVRQAFSQALQERWHALVGDDLVDPASLPKEVDSARLLLDAAPSPSDLVFVDQRGLWMQSEQGQRELLVPGTVERFVGLDLGEDKSTRDTVEGQLPDGRAFVRKNVVFVDAELALVRAGKLELWERPDYWETGPYNLRAVLLEGLLGTTKDLIAWDYDHDGDLDLALCGDYGLRFLRNDGADGSGVFTPDTEGFPINPQLVPDWLLPEDFDSDQDVDLLVGGPKGAQLFDSLRGGKFGDQSKRLPQGLDFSTKPTCADLDADFFTDLLLADGTFLKNRFGESFQAQGAPRPSHPGNAPALLVDWDQNGSADLLWFDAQGRLTGLLDLGQSGERELAPSAPLLPAGFGPALCLALGPGHSLLVGGQGSLLRLKASPAAPGFTLALKGIKDNSHGVGATVELRSGPIYRRIYWRNETLQLGLGGRQKIDVLRVTWPNGVIQSQLDLPAGAGRCFEQIEGLVGSCPFLYAWNGTKFEFVSDVIGITPLGLPMAPGMFVPPDHDEFVLIRGEQLKPKDGRLTLQFTEELREVTYLDQARLYAVDHPSASTIYPNERFTFPPFPKEHLYTITSSAAPLEAKDDQGRDWAAELAQIDSRFAEPFTPHRGQYMGLTAPYTLTLRFDGEAVRSAKKPRLVATGWFYWSDASVNMAVARHPDWEFVPPILEVPDGQGGWRPLGPPVGFPAGKTKTMVIELDGALNPDDPRLRLSSTLRLYWDQLILATCGDDAPVLQSEAPLLAGRLWERGFSERTSPPGQPLLEWFDWDNTAEEPRWNMHPGLYTKLGETLPLLTTIDDQFVILGAGDALTLEFDASKLPKLAEGQRRDYLLFLDGWAKDRDPNTSEALYVTPLPFHAMSGYPYGAEERYPDTPATRQYRRDWLTRPAKTWIEPLAPGAN